jgi:hypothetical protein
VLSGHCHSAIAGVCAALRRSSWRRSAHAFYRTKRLVLKPWRGRFAQLERNTQTAKQQKNQKACVAGSSTPTRGAVKL